MNNIIDYICPELMIMIPVLYFIGKGIKNSKLDDKYIPLVLGAIGVLISCLYVVSDVAIVDIRTFSRAMFTAITQGIMCAGCSVYINQLFKQNKK